MVLAVLAAKKYLSYVTPMYESTAKLKLADNEEGVPSANLYKDLDVFTTANKIATEIEVLKSETLLQRCLDSLNFNLEIYRKGKVLSVELFNNSPIKINGTFSNEKSLDKKFLVQVTSRNEFILFAPDQKEGTKYKFGKPFSVEGGTILITLNDEFIAKKKDVKIIDNYEFEFLSNQKLLDKINKNIDIVPVDKDVPVIRINLKSNVPEKAALFVNQLAQAYITDYIESKYKAANTTVDFLKREINDASGKLANSENNIQNYRDKKNVINVRQETETDLRKISQLKIQLSSINMSLDAIKDLNKYIDSGKNNYLELAPNFEAFTDLLSTEMVKNIKKFQAEKKDLLLTYTPDDERVKVIDAKIKDLVDYQIESIKNTERNLQIKHDDLINDIEESEKVFIGLPEKEKILNDLNREFNLYETSYNFLNEKKIEAEIAKSAKIAFHKVITQGEISKTPVSPIRSIIIIIAAILGMFGSIILIYLVHFAKAKVNDIHTIEKNSTIPIALATPHLKNEESIHDNFLKEAVQLELKGILENKKSIIISSYDKVEDHLFHSRNFIKAFRNQERKVLVIDATGKLKNDITQDEYNGYLDISSPKYLSYTKAAMQNMIEEKMQGFDLCLINNQAIKEEKLALSLMSIASHNLLVLDSRTTAEKAIITIELLKDEFNLPNLWFVLNKTGYNPSVLKEIKTIYNKYIRRNKK